MIKIALLRRYVPQAENFLLFGYKNSIIKWIYRRYIGEMSAYLRKEN